MVVVVDAVDFFAWFSEKPCLLFIARCCEGSLSGALMVSDLLPVGFVVFVVVDGGGGGAVAVAVDVVAADGVVGICAWLPLMLLLWSFSLSSALSASLSSCWYISSTMGFHNRTLALMNQFDT